MAKRKANRKPALRQNVAWRLRRRRKGQTNIVLVGDMPLGTVVLGVGDVKRQTFILLTQAEAVRLAAALEYLAKR